MVRRGNFSLPHPPPPPPHRQHFREKFVRCSFQYPKVPLETGAPPIFWCFLRRWIYSKAGYSGQDSKQYIILKTVLPKFDFFQFSSKIMLFFTGQPLPQSKWSRAKIVGNNFKKKTYAIQGVYKKMSPVKLSAERVLKNMYSKNCSVATSSAVSVCARLLVRFHTCSKLHICTYNRISNQSRFFHGSIVFTPKFLA